MKKLILASLAAAMLCAAPLAASAQDVRIRAGEGGVTVRTDGDRDHRRDGRRDWNRGDREGRHDGMRDDRRMRAMHGDRCRVVSVRTVRPNGDVVIRRSRQCR